MSPLTDEEGRILLRVARQALEEAVRGQPSSELEGFSGALAEKSGAFVTLHRADALRGCIGQVEPREPLVRTVAECAVAAALRDPRFAPVIPAELPELVIEVSALSPLVDIRPEEIEVGRHGLLISSAFGRGLLLPQVAVEWHWDRERFLEQTCRKAGLPADTWRRGGRIQAFTTQVFTEVREAGSASSSSVAMRASEHGWPRP